MIEFMTKVIMDAVYNTSRESENIRNKETRIVLIGCTGAGKSSFGNTLLGDECFDESASSKSVTMECEISERIVGRRKIKIVDTPGIISSDGTNMASVLGNFFDFLFPGPHAIIIVIAPNRDTAAARKALKDLQSFFGDEHFLDFTMLVMVRKHEIIRKEIQNIQEFITKKSAEDVKQLYKKCKERVVAVENLQARSERQKDAEKVFEVIDNMDGYYGHAYFKKISDEKRTNKEITDLKEQVQQLRLEKQQQQEQLEKQKQKEQVEKNKRKTFYFF